MSLPDYLTENTLVPLGMTDKTIHCELIIDAGDKLIVRVDLKPSIRNFFEGRLEVIVEGERFDELDADEEVTGFYWKLNNELLLREIQKRDAKIDKIRNVLGVQ